MHLPVRKNCLDLLREATAIRRDTLRSMALTVRQTEAILLQLSSTIRQAVSEEKEDREKQLPNGQEEAKLKTVPGWMFAPAQEKTRSLSVLQQSKKLKIKSLFIPASRVRETGNYFFFLPFAASFF